MRIARPGGAAAAVAALLLALTACSTPHAAPQVHAPHAGAYPVAVPDAAVTREQTVRQGGYALVAAGNPVRVRLHDADLEVAVSGPDLDVPEPAPGEPISAKAARGVLTVTATATRGSTTISGHQFLGLDEEQDAIDLGADSRAATVSPGHQVTLHLRSRFASGHTTLTWQPFDKPLVTWDFTIEID